MFFTLYFSYVWDLKRQMNKLTQTETIRDSENQGVVPEGRHIKGWAK